MWHNAKNEKPPVDTEVVCKMKHYTDTVPLDLAEKLKAAGMPIETTQHNVQGMIYEDYAITYASVFDFFLTKGLHVIVEPYWDFAKEIIDTTYEWSIVKSETIHAPMPHDYCETWHEAANAATEKAIEIIQ